MHACGHDVHATWAVGAAALLAAAPADGNVLIVLQPAEEIDRGAAAVLDAGVLDGVSAIFGGHVDRRFAVGQVVADDGPLAASADTFAIELIGRGAHAARPQESADPVVGAGALIGAVQSIVARRLHPAIPAVLTIATVHAGTANNIIPDRAVLTGTIRTVDPATRQLVREELERIKPRSPARTVSKPKSSWSSGRRRSSIRTTCRVGPRGRSLVLGDSALAPLGIVNLAARGFFALPGAHARLLPPHRRARSGRRADRCPLAAFHRGRREHSSWALPCWPRRRASRPRVWGTRAYSERLHDARGRLRRTAAGRFVISYSGHYGRNCFPHGLQVNVNVPPCADVTATGTAGPWCADRSHTAGV